ncbi:serine palmitoyltransferase [Oceanibacterium hippocampi]|uniref:8-amino-7-oxononanoate synthase n=1 Tax=Oceanibacterium hippocampi TaxID=745714 RepID=A0A1Y5TY14_9PROT|nr:aminotransferase class I/II-fold pyridoxal phosphate-dependent enzyme [Oceanibacterium hippocampi]SLN76190.1 8-amino-7-oxononanoate synthase [Oceanibacterium hippocampi]
MDIFEKYRGLIARHDRMLEAAGDPFNVCMERLISPTEAIIDGKRTILFGTNNYLGLTFDPHCIEQSAAAVREQGTGTTGSRIANGTYKSHRDLETEIAGYLGKRTALVFSTGYQANLGTLVGLAGPDDIILIDADSHASIYDGCKLTGATVIRFRHNNPADLDKRLARIENKEQVKLVVVEGIYSMFGDMAPIAEFVDVKKRHGAFLMVDEAHSFGVSGDHGRGVAEAEGVEADVDFVVGTFSKSLGAIGGYAASDHPDFDTLRFVSRPYMFTASPSPATAASVRAALECMRDRPELRTRLWENARRIHQGLEALGFETCSPASPIIALRMSDEVAALTAWRRLLDHGIYVNLAVPPGTPNGVCLLRCSVSAAHSNAQIDEILRRFGEVASEILTVADAG